MPKTEPHVPPLRWAFKKGIRQPRPSILRALDEVHPEALRKCAPTSNGSVAWQRLRVGVSQPGNKGRTPCTETVRNAGYLPA